ncbi:MAG: hypothetical protein SGBAC_013490 [Bacillariaceae sp.]
MNQAINLSPKKRCSNSIQERIAALQSSGLQDQEQKRKSLNLSDLQPRKHSSADNSVSSLDLSTSIQLPLTPSLEDDNKPSTKRSRGVSFSNMMDICFIPHLDDSVDYDSLYYKEDEIADFRHEAFLEDCGLADML